MTLSGISPGPFVGLVRTARAVRKQRDAGERLLKSLAKRAGKMPAYKPNQRVAKPAVGHAQPLVM